MKKVRVTLKPGSSGKKIYMFSNSESLYVWLKSLEADEQVVVPDLEELLLEPGGFMEVELLGFEYAFEVKDRFHRLDVVRIGKAMPSRNAAGLVVTVHGGWVNSGLLPLKSFSDADIEIVPITEEESKIDFETVKDDMDDEESDEP